jgi:cytidine deaminase
MDYEIKRLLEKAKQAKENSYAPYSNFHVGAAVVGKNDKIYSGSNVENSSYGLTICAERNAIFKMVNDGEREISAILIIGDTEEFLPPCGACRQVISEFSTERTIVYMCNKYGKYKKTTVEELIPFKFSIDFL